MALAESIAAIFNGLGTPFRALAKWYRRRRLGGRKRVRLIEVPHRTFANFTDDGAAVLHVEFKATNVNPFPVDFVKASCRGSEPETVGVPVPSPSPGAPAELACNFLMRVPSKVERSKPWRIRRSVTLVDQYGRKHRTKRATFVVEPQVGASEPEPEAT